MIHTKAFITINGQECPVDIQITTQTTPPKYNLNEELKRLHNTTITCQMYPEGTVYQPTGPVVEGSIEPLQG